uniref:IBR domain-containing protein n=1 Tax=Caenorhabditis tropicalis TaxID=1561998 RepID=A0A1I7TYN2_9PELO
MWWSSTDSFSSSGIEADIDGYSDWTYETCSTDSMIIPYEVYLIYFGAEERAIEHLLERRRGKKRWFGREHHKGKERLHKSVKNRKFIQKIIKSNEPLSKNATKRISESTKDDLKLNVFYSLYKKNRWRSADHVSLLKAIPENLNAEVVEKNTLETCGYGNPAISTFAVHSKRMNKNKKPGKFEIRSATSSGKGQDYSNFLPATREFSKKANAKSVISRGEKKELESQPMVSYNVYKTHPNQEVVGKQMFKSKAKSKSKRRRGKEKIYIEDYEYEEDYEEEEDQLEEVIWQRHEIVLDMSQFPIRKREKQMKRNKKKDISSGIVVEELHPEPGYTNLLNIQEYLRKEGYTFENFDVTFHNQTDNFERQIDEIREEKKLKIKDLRPHQYLIDVSEWCRIDGEMKDGETISVIVITHLKKNNYNFIINSTIAQNPSKRGSEALIKRISHALTLKEAISKITSEILTSRKIVETMKMSTLYYGRKTFPELLKDPEEWENQMVNMKWPNQHYHATWANSEELSQIGEKLEWNDLCLMVKKENWMKTGYTSNDKCGVCSQEKRSHDLFLMENESKIKCSECLREEFYRELRAKRIPIDLQTDTADELEYLPTFIPLTVINLYIRMVSETIYKDLGATGDFVKCPSCKSAVFFETIPDSDEKKTQNRSCPCGYSWCKHCDRVPHWPMKCEDLIEWEEKWLLRYAMKNAQGSGTETLLQVTCSCEKQIYNVLLPEEFIECPQCKTNVNMNTMRTVWKHYYYPFDPILRKLIKKGYYVIGEEYKNSPYVPRATVYTDIVKIPGIRASVVEICASARDIRFDENFRNRAVNREHILIRKNIMEKEVVENLFGTSVYLVENVTAWMYMTNQYDRNMKILLEIMMENRVMLSKAMEGENSEFIRECLKKLKKNIDKVVSSVEKKILDAPSSV